MIKELIGLTVFAVILIIAATAVTVQARYDITKLYPVEDTEVLTPVPAPTPLTPQPIRQ